MTSSMAVQVGPKCKDQMLLCKDTQRETNTGGEKGTELERLGIELMQATS